MTAIIVAIGILAVLRVIHVAWTLLDEVERLGRLADGDEGEW